MDKKDQGNYTSLSSIACAEPGMAPLAAARGELIVVNKLAGNAQFFDADSLAMLSEIEMAKFPHEVVISPDRNKAYISIYGQGVFSKNSEAPGREVAIMYHDCDPADAAAAIARLVPQNAFTGTQELRGIAWRERPTTYVICTDDRTISPKLQRVFAERMGSDVVEWPTSHSPMLSQPQLVADLLVALARA